MLKDAIMDSKSVVLDFQKEVGCVPKSVSHALDDLDAVVDAFEDR